MSLAPACCSWFGFAVVAHHVHFMYMYVVVVYLSRAMHGVQFGVLVTGWLYNFVAQRVMNWERAETNYLTRGVDVMGTDPPMLTLLSVLWKQMDEYRNGVILPWWDEKNPITHDGDATFVRHTVWQTPDHRLLIIGNLGVINATVTVSADAAASWEELYPTSAIAHVNVSFVRIVLHPGMCTVFLLSQPSRWQLREVAWWRGKSGLDQNWIKTGSLRSGCAGSAAAIPRMQISAVHGSSCHKRFSVRYRVHRSGCYSYHTGDK